MNLREVKEYLENNPNDSNYIADEFTAQGYGQTMGAYHDEANNMNVINPTQKWHFIHAYYGNKEDVDKMPTFVNLHCPELLLWIAEVAGLNKHLINQCAEYIIKFENENNLFGTNKNATYIKPIENEVKQILHIYDINKIICEASNWDEVREKVKKLC